jgi:hypothetical protein
LWAINGGSLLELHRNWAVIDVPLRVQDDCRPSCGREGKNRDLDLASAGIGSTSHLAALKKLHLKMRGVFFAPSDSHHVRRHLEKSRREKSCADPLKTRKSGLLDWKVGRFVTLENAGGVDASER